VVTFNQYFKFLSRHMAHKVLVSIPFAVLLFVALSCSTITDRITKKVIGDDVSRTNQLWSDVPQMDGMAVTDMDMPIPIKIVMRTLLNNLWRADKENENTPVSGDWIVFTTNATTEDIQNFYTNERMTNFGQWEPSKEPSCLDGKAKGVEGVLCVFQKVSNTREVGLAIIAKRDDETKQTHVFFLRLEKDAEPGSKVLPANAAPPHPRGSITKLNGGAPYGIEKRPMPDGSDTDHLLPVHVGPYTRSKLELASDRSTAPTTVQTDGSSVYATYVSEGREVFVELGLSSDPSGAQSALDTAASDATGGFPADSNLGSRDTEPSFLKVNAPSDAFFAWTRGGYYFSATAKGGTADLDAFMQSFPF
jgi:hypothetical protein